MVLGGERTRVLATGVGRCEGPVLRGDGSLLVTSMSHGRIYEISPDGVVDVLAEVGGDPNGLTLGPDGSLYVAQAGRREPGDRFAGGVQRITPDGLVEWVTEDPISPNDLCFGPDGMLYVTDPTRKPFRDGRLWRCDVNSGETRLLFSIDWYPNGIGFGLDDDALIVADTSGARLVRYPMHGRRLGEPEVMATLPYGVPDGFAFDTDGNLVLCAVHLEGGAGEVQVYDLDGVLRERHRPGPGSLYTNVAIDSAGTGYVTYTDGDSVIEISNLAGPGLPLHPRNDSVEETIHE
jgi:gluconolactonase